METSERTPDEHIASLPDDVRADIRFLDSEISKRIPDHAERVLYEGKFWGGSDQSIIGYGKAVYINSAGKTVEWFMVGLAKQKNYISMYVSATDDSGYVLARYADRLGKVKTGASSISFRSLDDIDLDALMELVEVAAGQSEV